MLAARPLAFAVAFGTDVRLNERDDSLRSVLGSEIAAGTVADAVTDGDTVCEREGVTTLVLGVGEALRVGVRLAELDPEPVGDGVQVALGDWVADSDGEPVPVRVPLDVAVALGVRLLVAACDDVADPLCVAVPDEVRV